MAQNLDFFTKVTQFIIAHLFDLGQNGFDLSVEWGEEGFG